MSENMQERRPQASHFVFPPEHSAPSLPLQSNRPIGASFGSGSNTVSMPFVRRHVTRRLKAAKADCDKELQRVTNSITAWFEEMLRDGDHERESERELREIQRDRDADSLHQSDAENLREPFNFMPAELRSALATDESSSDGGYDAEMESSRYSHQRASTEDSPTRPHVLAHSSSSPGLQATSSGQSLSPSLRRQSTLPWEKSLSASISAGGTTTQPTEGATSRKQSNAVPSAWNQAASSRRLSRTIHMPTRPTRSAQSSRSTSRSRSPLPPSAQPNISDSFSSLSSASSVNRRSSRIMVDDPIDPIMTALYDIIGVATDVTEMTINQLTAQPKVCESLVQRVQNIGKTWDEHPEWHGRNWYVQVLLAIASLSRVVEWWEAEKQFWNFDEDEDEEEELLTFVTKAVEEPHAAPTPTSSHPSEPQPGRFISTLDEEKRLRMGQTSSQGKKARDEQPKSPPKPGPSSQAPQREAVKATDQNESARVLATERLRLQAEMAQNQNIVLELALDGDHILWANYAWRIVVGTDPDDLAGTRISHLLSPNEWNIFRTATQRLQKDDSHTVEVRFRLRVQAEDDWEPAGGTLFQQMESKGMLMVDREDGRPSHTMWVIKPVAPPRYETDLPPIAVGKGEAGDEAYVDTSKLLDRSSPEPPPPTPFAFDQPISTEPILCRICDAQIPQWYFEKHNETCVETHRLEAEICDCNESITELRNTIRDLVVALSSGAVPEYRGMAIFSPSTSPSLSSPLQLFRANKLQRLGVKWMQQRLLEQLDDTLQATFEVSIPALKEEESKEPIERQRLLSPTSERKVSQFRNWNKPNTEDAALGQLVQDAERVMRQKIDNVVRMQNTIRYSEKIWHEWQEKVAQVVEADVAFGEGPDSSEDDHSSTTSEYAFIGEGPSSEPTPMASSSIVSCQPESKTTTAPAVVSPLPAPAPVAFSHSRSMHTRSSTPSSISSPLALAAPIMASSSPEDVPPPIDLGEASCSKTDKRKSVQNILDAKSLLTPPLSPLVSPRDGRRRDRCHSAASRPPALSPSGMASAGPLSPRQPSAGPLSRTTPASIKDFEIIKPISKGAFGSVFLAKKKATGDYYAIKVLKKADMIAKNQITNVKAERMILIQQAESPFVAKLYFTFQSKDNLYLVMEYLNGGDCAALIKSIGALPEQWTKSYIAEVVLGLEYLHQRGVVHRDLKPDNLLIDQHGHLKMTDFGLSRSGLLGRQTRESHLRLNVNPTRYHSRSRPPSVDSGYLSSPLFPADIVSGGSYFNQRALSVSLQGSSAEDGSDLNGASDTLPGIIRRRSTRAGEQSFATELTHDLRSYSNVGDGAAPQGEQKFVGTPDYLAPETILGLRGDDAAVDWWALGVITYEFLYGIPPFHADTPEKVFENILSGHIDWHEEWVTFAPETRDFMQRLLVLDPNERLGANGAEEVKAHPFFKGINWDTITTSEAAFIPQVDDPESTDYFDPRGAVPQLFRDDEPVAITNRVVQDSPAVIPSPSIPSAVLPLTPSISRDMSTQPGDDFGSFSFKNLPVLKQANDDVIRKLKTDQMAPMAQALTEPGGGLHGHNRRKSVSQRAKKPPCVVTSTDKPSSTNPPSPATSTSSIASSPSRISQPPSTPGSAGSHLRKPSEYGAVERFKLNHLEGVERRNSMPSRLRTASVSSVGDGSGSEIWPPSVGHGSGHFEVNTPPSSVHSIDLKKVPDPTDRAVTCLLAEDNPITAKIIETLLIRLGCRCVVVADGSEAISVAMGDIKFDCILMDLHMPVLDGEGASRYIKTTNGRNANTPIIAISAYGGVGPSDSNLFAAFLSKPLQKADLLSAMRRLGFKTSTAPGPETAKSLARSIST